MLDALSANRQAVSVLFASTLAFSACFAVWVIFAVIGIPVKHMLGLSELQFGLLLATPVLSGSLLRLPLGLLTDHYGGRKIFMLVLAATVPSLYLLGEASQYWQFILLGLLVGIAGASFSVGIAYTATNFPPARRGLAMGIFGAGNAGAALTHYTAPALLLAWGWEVVPQVYAVALLGVLLLFWMLTADSEASQQAAPAQDKWKQQLALLRNPRIWKYCQYYSLVFGGFVGLSLWMTQYYVSEYRLELDSAAWLAGVFVLSAGLVRIAGGWLADRYGAYRVTWGVMWVSWVCLFLLSYPQTAMSIATLTGEPWQFSLGLNVWAFSILLFILGTAWGLGKAAVFKGVADEFPEDIGLAAGVVGMVGGLGGFLLPILFGLLVDITRINSSIFMLLYGATCVSLLLMYFTFGREHAQEVIEEARTEAKDEIALQSMADVVAGQRKALQELLGDKMKAFTQDLGEVLHDRQLLEARLEQLKPLLGEYKYLYALDADGIQISANLGKEGRDEDHLGRDRSARPYMEGMFEGIDFKLSESYISRNQRRPSLTAVHTIRHADGQLAGFVGVDYDLRSLPRKGALFKGTGQWRQLKGDPSIRGGLFMQERTQSVMDDHIDDVLRLMEVLMLEHGIHHVEMHFSSSRANIWHIESPYSYHILGVEELIDPDICLAYPQQAYDDRATVPAEHIGRIFEKFRELRFADETIYLRAGSLNLCSGMVGLNFSCDGSHFMHYDEFLEKGHEFWFGV